MLVTTTAMLPTTQYMNSSYSMECVLGKLCSMLLRPCLPLLFLCVLRLAPRCIEVQHATTDASSPTEAL